MEDTFFALLRSALWDRDEDLPQSLSQKETGNILRMAGEQAVTGLIACAIIKNNINIGKTTPIQLIALSQQIKTTNINLNKEIAEFVRLMNSNDTDYIIVKGQTVAALYREPYTRMPGDIDFYVKDYKGTAETLSKEWHITLPEKLIDKEASFTHNNSLYEIHRNLVNFGSKKHQKYWDELMKKPPYPIDIDGIQVNTFEPTIYAVYVFLHLFFHFIYEGVGLRQLCDWAIMLDAWKDKIDTVKLNDILENLGMKNAYTTFGSILVDNLGLTYFPLPITDKDRARGRKVLKDILRVGNFGKYGRKKKNGKWSYKFETMRLALINSFKYYSLAPTEIRLTIPKLVRLNLKLIASRN